MNNELITIIKDIIGQNYNPLPEENLFGIGFDSIKIMNLVSILRRNGYDVNFSQFLKNPTINYWNKLLKSNKNKITTNINYNIVDKFPLSEMQYSYWVGSKLPDNELGEVAAHIYVEFDGYNIDPVILEKSIHELIKRHEMLRVKVLDDATQKILPEIKNKIFNLIDLRNLSFDDVNQQLEKIRQQKSNQNIQKQYDKVIDITLSLLPNYNTRLHIDVSMIAADAVSYRILLRELAILYNNKAINVLSKINYSYKEYILYQTNSKSQEAFNNDKNWWNNKLNSFPNPPQLPLKTNFKLDKITKAKRLHYWISDKDKLNIQNNCKYYKVTMAMTLLTAFAHSISTHSKDFKFFLNIPLFNRQSISDQVDDIVGDFSSSILLEVDFSNNLSIIEQINKISNSFVENISHSNYSAINVLRDLSKKRQTLFLAPVVYTSAINLGEIFGEEVKKNFGKPVWIISQGPQVILDAQITEFEEGLLANWDVREGLFLPNVVETMFEIYKQNLNKLSSTHDLWLEKFNLDAIDKQILLRNKFNNIKFKTSTNVLHQGFFENAKLFPNKIALIWKMEDGIQKSYTYAQLSQLAINFATLLYQNNVNSSSSVALSLPKGYKQVIAVLAILYLGASYLPISLKYPLLRKRRILEIAKVNFYVVDSEDDIICDVNTKFLIFNEKIINNHNNQTKQLILPYPDINSIAYIIFTSGTTGDPKGVAVSHKAVMNTLESINLIFQININDISLAFSELEFDLSVQDIFAMFNKGATVVLLDDKNKYNPDYWIELINQYKVTQVYATPSVLDLLLSTKPNISLPSLKLVISGGDKISFNLYTALKKRNPQCRFVGAGGATEVAIHCTYFEVKEFDDKLHCVPYGYPLFNMSCKVVNEQNQECPNWVIGELLVSGPGLADGYINMPCQTKEKFFNQQGIRWYKTSDLVRYSDKGVIEYISRKDNQVKIRGYRVELSEIEGLLNKLEYVKNSVVFVNHKQGINLIAYVEIEAEDKLKNLNSQLLKNELSRYLPSYMIPEIIIIVSKLPVTSNAKIDRKQLQEQFSIENHNLLSNLSIPNTALEKFIAMQYAKFTGAKNVYLENDFFSLGGDSILATKLISTLKEDLILPNITISDIFDYRSVNLFTNRLKQLESQENILEKTAEILLEIESLTDDELLNYES